MDGSQKLPQRLLGTIRDRLARGLPIRRLALTVAAWMVYVGGQDEQGKAFEVRDPLAAKLASALASAGDAPGARVAALLGVDAVFGADLAANQDFRRAVATAYRQLLEQGAKRAVAACR